MKRERREREREREERKHKIARNSRLRRPDAF